MKRREFLAILGRRGSGVAARSAGAAERRAPNRRLARKRPGRSADCRRAGGVHQITRRAWLDGGPQYPDRLPLGCGRLLAASRYLQKSWSASNPICLLHWPRRRLLRSGTRRDEAAHFRKRPFIRHDGNPVLSCERRNHPVVGVEQRSWREAQCLRAALDRKILLQPSQH
jgi:hypothetical protein